MNLIFITPNEIQQYYLGLKVIGDIEFTPREIDVISCILNGRTAHKEISILLSIVPKVVESHKSNIKRKLQHVKIFNVRDFIEQSDKYDNIRKHYAYLLQNYKFKETLYNIGKLNQSSSNHTKIYYIPCENSKFLIGNEKAGILSHLRLAGFYVEAQSIKHTTKEEINAEVHAKNDIIFLISQEMTDYLNTHNYLRDERLHNKGNEEYIYHLNCDNNYYFSLLDLIKQIYKTTPTTKLDSIIESYKKRNNIKYIKSALLIDDQYINVNNILPASLRFRGNKILLFCAILCVAIPIHFIYEYTTTEHINIEPIESNIHLKKIDQGIVSYLPELLTSYEKFTGRKSELDQLDSLLSKDDIVIITGRAGVGKSTYAVEYGKKQKTNKVVRYFYADSADKIEQGYRTLATELGIDVTTQTKDIVAQLVHDKLNILDVPMLFIFDNVDKYDDVKDYLVNLPRNVKSIVTTKSPRLISYKPHISLVGFGNKEAVHYIQYSLQDRNLSNSNAQELIKVVGILPYDLKCVVAYLLDNPSINTQTITKDVAAQIKDKLFQQFAESNDVEKQLSWKILQYISNLDPDYISMEILKQLFPRDQILLSGAIKKLESLSLISVISDKNGQTGLRVHRELQEATKCSARNHPKYALAQATINYNLLDILDVLFPKIDSNPDIRWQIANRLQAHVKKIIEETTGPLNKVKLHQANLYHKLSKYYLKISIDLQQALKCAIKALELRQTIHDANNPDIAEALNNVGNIYEELGDAKNGIEYYFQALKIRQNIFKGNHPDIAQLLNDIGVAYRRLGDSKNALDYGMKALRMRQNIFKGNHPDISESLGNIGVVYQDTGDIKKGLEYKLQALQIRKALYPGINHPDIARTLSLLAWSYYELKDYTEAINYASQCVAMYQVLYPDGNPRATYVLHTLGASLIQIQDVKNGMATLYRALEIGEKFKMGKYSSTAFVYYDLGRGYFKLKEYKKALENGEKSLSIRRELYSSVKNHREIAASLYSLAEIHHALGNSLEAIAFYNEALTMRRELFLEDTSETKLIKQKTSEL